MALVSFIRTDDNKKIDYKDGQFIVDYKNGQIYTDVNDKRVKLVVDVESGNKETTKDNIFESNGTPLFKNVISGNSYQEVRSGKNLLDVKTNIYGNNINGLSYTFNNDGSIRLYGTCAETWGYLTKKYDLQLPIGTYTFSIKNVLTHRIYINATYTDDTTATFIIGIGKTETTFTTKKEIKQIQVTLSNMTAGNTYDETIYPQLEEGSTATSWEQYGAMPSPDYPSEIESVGVINYFDKDNANILNGYISVANKKVSASSTTRTLYIPCNSKTTYTIIKIASKRFAVGTTPTTPNTNVTLTNAIENNTSTSLTITTGENDKFLCVYYCDTTQDTINEQEIINSIMIVKGSKIPNTYVPYGNWLVQKITGKNLFIPTLTNNGTAIIRQRSTVVLNDDEYQFTSTGADMYFGNVGSAGTSYSNELGTLYEVKPNNNYIFSLTNDEFNSIHVTQWNKDKIYVLRTNTSNSNVYKFTTNNDTKYISIRFGKKDAIVGTIYKTKCLLEQNDNATPYEPYKETIVKQSLNKENLFDKELSTKNAWLNWQTGMIDTSSDPNVVSDYIKVKVGKTYYITGADDLTVRIMSYNDKTSNKKTTLVDNTKKYYFVPDAEYVRIAFGSGDAISSINKFKVYEETSTPYYELNKIGDTKDEVDLVNGTFIKRIGKVVLDGSESWSINNTNAIFYAPISYIPLVDSLNTKADLHSDKFIAKTWNECLQTSTQYGIALHNSIPRIGISNKNYTEVNDFKTWLSNNNVIIYYQLLEPEIIQLEPNIIETFDGTNILSIESNIEPSEIEIEYANINELKFADSDLTFMYIKYLEDKIKKLDGNYPIDQGENYTKFGDGTLICYGKVTMPGISAGGGTQSTINFPAEFKDINYSINATIVSVPANWSWLTWSCAGKETDKCEIYFWNNLGGAQIAAIDLDYIAIGRWK